MIADIRFDKPDGSWVLTKITHVIKGRPTHTVHVYQNFPDKTQRCAAGIVLSSEVVARAFITCMMSGDLHHPDVEEIWKRNKLEEIYNG